MNASSSRKSTSRELVERALAAIEDPLGEGARTFLRVHRDAALSAADRIDHDSRMGARPLPLAGMPISIKDNFDEAGAVTLAGSKVLAGTPPAARDSIVVERLRAGAPGVRLADSALDDDLGRVVDFLAAATWLGDCELFAGHLDWLARVSASRGAPATALPAVLEALRGELHDFPFALTCLDAGHDLLAARR